MTDKSGNTVIKERVARRLDKLDQIESSSEAQTQISVLPLAAVHEARYALQQLKEKYGVDEDLFEIFEPISRIIGWVEASSYFLDVTTQREALKTMFSAENNR